jgi:flagellar protein FlaG
LPAGFYYDGRVFAMNIAPVNSSAVYGQDGMKDSTDTVLPLSDQSNQSMSDSVNAVDANKVQAAVQKFNEAAEKSSQQVRLAWDNKADRMVIDVVDQSSGKILSTVPSQQILDMLASLDVKSIGKLLDKQL